MAATAKLNITKIDPNQYQKEVTANTAFDTLDAVAGDIPFSPLITVGAKVGASISVVVQLRNQATVNNAFAAGMLCWLADSANAAPSAVAPSGGINPTTGYRIVDLTANILGFFTSNGSGQLVLNITQATARTWYLHVKLADKIFVSSAITF